jgi:hypothetical protein
MRGEGNPMYGKRGEKSPHYGRRRPDHSLRMSGERNPNFGKSREEIFGDKTLSGENHPFYGKKRPEHSEALKGRLWWNDGEGNVKFQRTCPGPGWVQGDVRNKPRGKDHHSYGKKNPRHSEKMLGNKHWVNEKGEKLFQKDYPGEGWQRGLKWKPQQ